jgi:putative chitobiose transport system substrate-binding protein
VVPAPSSPLRRWRTPSASGLRAPDRGLPKASVTRTPPPGEVPSEAKRRGSPASLAEHLCLLATPPPHLRRGAPRGGRFVQPHVSGLCALAALVLLAGGLAACGPGERDPNVVEFWTLQLSPTFDDYILGMAAAFEAEHPGITVRWVDVPFQGITQKFLASIASGRSPDVVNLPGDYLRSYVALGALRPLDSLLSQETLDSYLPSARDPLVFDGETYGVPWYLSTQILLYDRARVEAAGFTEDDLPETFSELLAFARRYGERTGDYAFFYPLVVEGFLFEVLQAEGIPMATPDGTQAAFNTPRAAAILQEWVDAFRSGVMPRESISQGHRAALQLFQSGTIAMFIGGPQYLRIVEENAPSIYRTTDVAPAVTGATGQKALAVMSLAVSTASANPEMAAAFAAFVTNAENQLAFSRRVPIYPSVTASLDDPYFTEAGEAVEERARVLGAAQLPESAVLRPSLRHYNRLQEAFKAHMLKAFLGTRTVEQALAAAESDWNKILAEQW